MIGKLVLLMQQMERDFPRSDGKFKKSHVLKLMAKEFKLDKSTVEIIGEVIDVIISLDRHDLFVHTRKLKKIVNIVLKSSCFQCNSPTLD